jgi:signal transduction histidine kinase
MKASSVATPESRSRSLAETMEAERGRIARELHSGAGQPLAGLKISLEVLESWCATRTEALPAPVREAIVRMHQLTDEALGQVRAVSHRLHPPDWQGLSIADALRKLTEQSGIAEMFAVTLELQVVGAEPPHGARVALYRCAQECIANAIRHSEATRFSMALTYSDGLVHLTVSDNGKGIPEGARGGGGIGLLSIGEYATAADGISSVSSGLKGTTIRVSLPLTED